MQNGPVVYKQPNKFARRVGQKKEQADPATYMHADQPTPSPSDISIGPLYHRQVAVTMSPAAHLITLDLSTANYIRSILGVCRSNNHTLTFLSCDPLIVVRCRMYS